MLEPMPFHRIKINLIFNKSNKIILYTNSISTLTIHLSQGPKKEATFPFFFS